MTGKLLSGLAAVAFLAGACLLVLNLSGSPRPLPDGQIGGDGGGAKILLRGVEIVEVHPGGRTFRLASDNASYSIPMGRVVASGVRLSLREHGDNVVASAPSASWDLDNGRIDLEKGVAVDNGAGWTANAPRARVDLKSEVIVAEEARLAGPGLTVEGKNLRWRWQDQTVALDSPRSSILPGRILAPGREG
jgi:hypothetical protein